MRNRVTAVLLAALMAVSLAACGKQPTAPAKGELLTAAGRSAYSIVLSQTATAREITAASELQDFVYRASNCRLPIETATEYDPEARVLSLGDNRFTAGSGVTVDRAVLGNDGFVLKTAGKSVVIAGGTDYGTLFGVYEFLHRTVGFEAYAADEIAVVKNTKTVLPAFDLTDVPDVAYRCVGFNALMSDRTYMNRMRTKLKGETWILTDHTHFKILPPADYMTDHPDWYSGTGTQLCMSRAYNNRENGMLDQFIQNVKTLIEENPAGEYIQLSQEDDDTFCNCASCQEDIEKYGAPSGILMRFTNIVAEEIDAWLKATYPERTMTVSTFAYRQTEKAPVVETENGYAPSHPDVAAADNVTVMLAPITADFGYSFFDSRNATAKRNIEGWGAVCGNMSLWTYSTNFLYYMLPFNNWNSMQKNYRIMKDYNFQYVYDQAKSRATMSTDFTELRIYVQSKLLWDSGLDLNALIDDFFPAYYKEAAPYVREVFFNVRMRYAMLEQSENLGCGYKERIAEKKYWPQPLLEQHLALYAKGLAACEPLKVSDPDAYAKVEARLRKESLTQRYLLIDLYGSLYNKAALAEMIRAFNADCTEFGITLYAEESYNTVSSLVDGWKSTYGVN